MRIHVQRIEGEYKDESGVIVRHGQGKYYCATTKAVYIGNWESDKMSGKGRFNDHFL